MIMIMSLKNIKQQSSWRKEQDDKELFMLCAMLYALSDLKKEIIK